MLLRGFLYLVDWKGSLVDLVVVNFVLRAGPIAFECVGELPVHAAFDWPKTPPSSR